VRFSCATSFIRYDDVRVQCAFIDTPEVEKITDFIGSQKAYATAYLLPEFVGEESGINLDMDISDETHCLEKQLKSL
jgi:hypothetical protein